MTIELVIEVEPTRSGTRLTQRLELRPRWYLAPVLALLWPLFLKSRAQTAMDRTVFNLKRSLELPDAVARGDS